MPAAHLPVEPQSQQSGTRELTNQSQTSVTATESENPEIITPQQMALIQNQIRRYKALAKKYNDLKSALQSSPPPLWQPHSLVSGLGSTAAQEGMLGLNVCDIGPASKFVSQSTPLVSLPQMLQLREKCLKNSQNQDDSSEGAQNPMLKLLSLQHALRSKIIGQNFPLLKASLQPFPLPIPLRTQPSPSGAPPPTEIRLLPADQFYRSKKSKRDVKGMDKDIKKRRADRDEVRRSAKPSWTMITSCLPSPPLLSLLPSSSRRVNVAFTRQLMVYREEFLRFHKGKYLECMKAARAVKQWIDNLELRKEKKDIKAGSLLATASCLCSWLLY
jgi:hypothetical protein